MPVGSRTIQRSVRAAALAAALVSGAAPASAGQDPAASAPYRLPLPAGWRSEVLPFPLDFAPKLPYVGVEELRFAPGMFTAGAEDYWSYAFVWWLEEPPRFHRVPLQDELSAYFRGLAEAVAAGKPGIDPSRSRYAVALDEVWGWPGRLTGTAEALDAFATGEPVKLNVRVKVLETPQASRQAWFFTLSPQPFSHPVWRTLEGIGDGFSAAVD